MEHREITMGQATYEVRRVFRGGRTLAELAAEQLAQKIPTARPVDGGRGHEV